MTDRRPWWVPEDGPGQRPAPEPVPGSLERRAVSVDAALEAAVLAPIEPRDELGRPLTPIRER